ncbi:MAG: hypothetical protein ACRDQ4_15270 [Pseudonocardiaceae bacterium]
MFGIEADTSEIDALLTYITAAGTAGRTRSEISTKHFKGHKPSAEIDAMLIPLVADGRVRQVVNKSGPGRPVTRYYNP